MMTKRGPKRGLSKRALHRPVLVALVLMLAGTGVPALTQTTTADARLSRIEAEVRALQRQVFPGDGTTFTPQNSPAQAVSATGTPASTPVSDMLTRMDSLETQMARLTAQTEENANKLRQIEARLAASASASAATQVTPTPAPTATAPAAGTSLVATPAPKPVVSTPAPVTAAAKPAVTTPRPAAAAAPSAQRVAAVRAIAKPQTDDAGDDEYSYGYRLWEAKFYPEAQQQLRLFLDRYPRHTRVSYARNLLGRALLDDGKPREAATWFLQNFQNNKQGDRAPDSLLFLAESMNRLKDTSRACIALAEFGETYPREAARRLKNQYDAGRAAVKCN